MVFVCVVGMKQRVEKEVRRVISIKSSRRLSALSVFSLAIYEKGEMKGKSSFFFSLQAIGWSLSLLLYS